MGSMGVVVRAGGVGIWVAVLFWGRGGGVVDDTLKRKSVGEIDGLGRWVVVALGHWKLHGNEMCVEIGEVGDPGCKGAV